MPGPKPCSAARASRAYRPQLLAEDWTYRFLAAALVQHRSRDGGPG
ncbi:MAG TPA: hypothetical protein VG474_00830 [Solirubrobacteraceae bacterium]|nr:hypothetical protein [Solirubrobacteraceae bacterium]